MWFVLQHVVSKILPTFLPVRTTCCPLRFAKQMWKQKKSINSFVFASLRFDIVSVGICFEWFWEDIRTNKYITKMPGVIKFFLNVSNYTSDELCVWTLLCLNFYTTLIWSWLLHSWWSRAVNRKRQIQAALKDIKLIPRNQQRFWLN